MADEMVSVDYGKYTFVVSEHTGKVSCLRFGEPWVAEFAEGGKALIALVYELDRARIENRILQNQLEDRGMRRVPSDGGDLATRMACLYMNDEVKLVFGERVSVVRLSPREAMSLGLSLSRSAELADPEDKLRLKLMRDAADPHGR